MASGKKKMNGMSMTAIGPMIKTGMMPIGAQMNFTTRMSMVCSRGKEKERKERKARKEKTMKEKANKEMAKANQSMYSHPLHRINPCRIDHNKFIVQILQHRVQGIRRGGQNVRDALAENKKERMKYDPAHVGQGGVVRPEVRVPVLEGDVDSLRRGLRHSSETTSTRTS